MRLAAARGSEIAPMPLHQRDDVREKLTEPIFARSDIATALPKYHFPPLESAADDVFQVVSDELLLDGNARQNLATFCQTWEEPQVHALMDLESEIVAPRGLLAEADRAEVELAHGALLEAVEARDGDRAHLVMRLHIEDVQRRVDAQTAGS